MDCTLPSLKYGNDNPSSISQLVFWTGAELYLNNENCHIMLMDVANESLHKISVPHGHRKSVVFLMMGDYLSSISATCLLSSLAIHILGMFDQEMGTLSRN